MPRAPEMLATTTVGLGQKKKQVVSSQMANPKNV